MKIERREGGDLVEVVRDGLHALVHGGGPPQSEEERLLDRRDTRWRRLRGHWHAYLSVMTGLGVLNLVTWLVFGVAVPWVLFPAAGWGIGLGIHALNHNGWMNDHEAALEAAEVKLGRRLPSGAPVAALPPGDAAPPSAWDRVLAECRAAVDKTLDALTHLDHPAQDVERTHADLEEGLERIERLAEGAARIQRALAAIAPAGLDGLDAQIRAVDADINQATDERLRAVQHENRALLVARRAKVQALVADEARMLANAKSFLLATENLHLDTARLGQDSLSDEGELVAPIRRLDEELEILRKVDSELRGVARAAR